MATKEGPSVRHSRSSYFGPWSCKGSVHDETGHDDRQEVERQNGSILPYHLDSLSDIRFIDPWRAGFVKPSDDDMVDPATHVPGVISSYSIDIGDEKLPRYRRNSMQRRSSLHRLSVGLTKFIQGEPFWLALYFLFNLGLTLYNKMVLVTFPFPYTLTAMHALCGSFGCYILRECGIYVPARLTSRQNITLLSFSVLYAVNIAVSNLSLHLVTVPFHQVVRAASPLFTIVLAYLITRTPISFMKVLSLLPVVAGVGFTTYGDYYFTPWGLILTLLGTLLASLKTVVANLLQAGPPLPVSRGSHSLTKIRSTENDAIPASKKQGGGGGNGLRLHPLDLLGRMSPLAFIQCVVYGWASGELDGVTKYGALKMDKRRMCAIWVNGMIAFGLNVVSFTANKKSGPLSISVAANVKQVLTVLLAVSIFDLVITPMNMFGVGLTLAGGGWYAVVEYRDKQRRKPLNNITSLRPRLE
ncbi:UAA transporter [Serendipita sp. 398]|nr:UAA transporter [Serendipita sp. 398]